MLQKEFTTGLNPAGNPKIKSVIPEQGTRDDLHVQTARHVEKPVRTGDELTPLVPTALSVATGGAVIGGILLGMPGAIVGGVGGALLGATAYRRSEAS